MGYKKIGSILLEKGLIDEEMLKRALDDQATSNERLGTTLVKLGYLTKENKLVVLSDQLDVPTIGADEYPKIPPAIERMPTKKFLNQYKMVPIEEVNGTLRVAVSDTFDIFPLEVIKKLTALNIEPVLGDEGDIAATIEAYYEKGPATMENILKEIELVEVGDDSFNVDDIENLKDKAQEAPIVNLVNLIISKSIERKASDIHIEPFEDSLHIRYRIDGIMHHSESLPRRLQPAITSRIKIMAKLNIAERRLPQDGRIKLRLFGKDVDIRISTVPTLFGESVVMRVLDTSGIISVKSIGFALTNREIFEGLIKQPNGIVLVTGPTGSGKTTTLYAALSMMDTVSKKVITIEDPVEYNLEGVNQMQVKPKIGLTFANGLRSIVRQDPDVIMVGEIRDAETAEIAIHSALTGHLVLSTLHTNDAPGAVTRLIDMGIEGYLISSSLMAVVAQRLVRVICADCKVESLSEAKVFQAAEEECKQGDLEVHGAVSLTGDYQQRDDTPLYRGGGCEKCGHTGYRGRVGIFEIMLIDDAMRNLIVEKRGADVLRQQAIKQGMIPLRDDGLDKVRNGITTLEEVVRVTREEN